MAAGILLAAGAGRAPPAVAWEAALQAGRVAGFTTYQLIGTVAGRAWNSIVSVAARLLGRGRRPGEQAAALQRPREWAAAPNEPVSAVDAALVSLDILVATGFFQPQAARLAAAPRRLRRDLPLWPEPPELAPLSAAALLSAAGRRAPAGIGRRIRRALRARRAPPAAPLRGR